MAKKEKKKSTFWADFKAFITKGNVIDMAVGVVIGGAFGKIVTGLVNYVINPCVSLLTGGVNLDAVKTVLVKAEDAVLDAEGVEITPAVEEVAILWGTWIQTILDFIIVAFCIFFVLRIIVKIRAVLEAEKNAEADAKAKAAAEKAAADKAAADAAAAALAEKQAALDASILKQEEILAEIRDIMKNK